MSTSEIFPFIPETFAVLVNQHNLGLAWVDAGLHIWRATANLAGQFNLASPLEGLSVTELAPELEDAAGPLDEVRRGVRPAYAVELASRGSGAARPDYVLVTFYPLASPLIIEGQPETGLLLICQRIRLGELIKILGLSHVEMAPLNWPLASLIDPLTQLGNHQAFTRELAGRAVEAAESSSDLAVAIIDLDNFQAINESHGHVYGDQLLQSCAQALLYAIRRNDTSFRTGGDEFAVLLPATLPDDFDGLYQRFERIFEQVRQEGFPETRASIGLAAISETRYDPEQTLQLAIQRMQIAKKSHHPRLRPPS
jgi:diguanylate cyclase (GGDEF)-like protein